jgi:tRNA G18 (ribose-2'-O)-methylase SpoU
MAVFVPIADPLDPKIAGYCDIRDRDLIGRSGLFMAEGRVVLTQIAKQHPQLLCSLLVADQHQHRLDDILSRLDADLPVYVVSQPILDTISGFPLHRGLLGLGRIPEPEQAAEALKRLPECARVLVLVGIANHDNMGGLFRNAAAFGVDLVVLDQTCCDPFYRKALRVSVGATATLPFVRLDSGADLVEVLTAAGLEPIALSPKATVELKDCACPRRWALVLGAEGPGLPQSVLDRCLCVGIQMVGNFDSLNVATTSGIALHHLTAGQTL